MLLNHETAEIIRSKKKQHLLQLQQNIWKTKCWS